MVTISSFLQALHNSPQYSFGWIVLAFLSVLPAIVSANMVQQNLSLFIKGQTVSKEGLKSLF